MERQVSYSMKGILQPNTGEIVFTDKHGVETVYDYKTLLEERAGQEVKAKFTFTEYDEEDEEGEDD